MVPALSLAPSSSWVGNDGSWSPFTISVGTPLQSFDVLLGTRVQNPWVPISDECNRYNITSCGSSRGVRPFSQHLSPGFQTNMSSTWSTIGIYELGIGRNLGINGNGFNGFDTVSVGNATVDHVPVIAYASPGFWVGQIGLLPSTLNFSNTVNSPSFLRTLKNDKKIPSLSYGYQAGAAYRGAKVPASLVLGGYDASRASSQPLTIPISSNLDFTVGVQNIVATNTFQGTNSLLSAPTEQILAVIDSSVPELWLPRTICDKFETAFNLTYNNQSGRYLITEDNRNKLVQQNPTLSFTLGSTRTTGGNTTIITLPYSAFDLEASFPIFAESTRYFPLRRAQNETQYTIGRAFLQEVYLGVDWERNVFNISQANFADPMPESKVVTIAATDDKKNNSAATDKDSKALPTGAIVGIVLGLIAIIAVLSAVFFCRRRRRQNNNEANLLQAEAPNKTLCAANDSELYGCTQHRQEVHGKETYHNVQEVHGNTTKSELCGTPNTYYELPGNGPKIHELSPIPK